MNACWGLKDALRDVGDQREIRVALPQDVLKGEGEKKSIILWRDCKILEGDPVERLGFVPLAVQNIIFGLLMVDRWITITSLKNTNSSDLAERLLEKEGCNQQGGSYKGDFAHGDARDKQMCGFCVGRGAM